MQDTPPPRRLRPVDAASLIIVDRSGRRPRLLMGRRHGSHRFMPNAVVFPGGRVETSDRAMTAFGSLDQAVEQRLIAGFPRPSPLRARALALCALRETAEETGILIGASGYGAPVAAAPAWSLFEREAVYPSLEGLTYVARAETPPGYARRFDCRFFAIGADAIATTVPGLVGPESELIDMVWLTCDEARRAETARITRDIIDIVEARLEAGLGRDLPVPFIRRRHGRTLRDAG